MNPLSDRTECIFFQVNNSSSGRPAEIGKGLPKESIISEAGSMPRLLKIVADKSSGRTGEVVGNAPVLSLAP